MILFGKTTISAVTLHLLPWSVEAIVPAPLSCFSQLLVFLRSSQYLWLYTLQLIPWFLVLSTACNKEDQTIWQREEREEEEQNCRNQDKNRNERNTKMRVPNRQTLLNVWGFKKGESDNFRLQVSKFTVGFFLGILSLHRSFFVVYPLSFASSFLIFLFC